jgi:UDP-galactopyranose mutase
MVFFQVSKYGAHIFHTNVERVWNYVNRYILGTTTISRMPFSKTAHIMTVKRVVKRDSKF